MALYGKGGKRWALTERGRRALRRDATCFEVGPSALSWERDSLTFRIDEITVPIPTRIRGVVRAHPSAIIDQAYALDSEARHHWRPMAPCARIEVELERPALRWAGSGYLDSNWGSEPLEEGFARWDWCRAERNEGTAVLYDVTGRNGHAPSLALQFGRSGDIQALDPPPRVRLPDTLWRIERGTRADETGPATVRSTLEDTPFYARSLVEANVGGTPVTAMHESLDLDRFRARWVQILLPFRMPRLR